ncbi:hypothetical protein WS75_24715 [Burkholderia sp. FL-7-2-10-S1-D7]|nr:hypothetical protein WS75_24715 [Burkholderia sp. FL-7-2-10-S1-D7]
MRGERAVGQVGRIEREIGAVVADEEIVGRPFRHDHREQRRAIDLPDEARVEPGVGAFAHQFVAEDIAADRAGERGRHAEPRADARHVPARAAGAAAPVLRIVADEIGQCFAEYDQAGERRRHVEVSCRGVSRGGAAIEVRGRAGPGAARGDAARHRPGSRVASRDQRGLLQPL